MERSNDDDKEVGVASPDVNPAVVTGLRVEEADKGVTYDDDDVSVVLAGTLVILFFTNFSTTIDLHIYSRLSRRR